MTSCSVKASPTVQWSGSLHHVVCANAYTDHCHLVGQCYPGPFDNNDKAHFVLLDNGPYSMVQYLPCETLLSPARYLSEISRQDSSQAQPTKVHICWSPPLSVTRWHCIEYPWWHCAVSSRYPWWHGHYYYSLMSCPVTLQTRGEHSSSPRMWSVSVQCPAWPGHSSRRSWGEYPLSESRELQLQPICLNSEHSSHLNVKVLNV